MTPYPKPTTYKNAKYLAWIRQQPCAICGRPAEPHHIIGVGHLGGMGKKAPDTMCMPLCREHHNEIHNAPAMWGEQWQMVATTLGRAIQEGVI